MTLAIHENDLKHKLQLAQQGKVSQTIGYTTIPKLNTRTTSQE